MKITLNGETHDLEGPLTVGDLLDQFDLKPTKIAVERNLEIVPKSAFDSEELHEGDRLEVVQFVGGG